MMLFTLTSAHPSIACVSALALATAPVEVVSDAEAKRLVSAAKQAFAAGDYADAAEKLEAAYLIEPVPTLLYPWAQAERSRGNCRTAIDLYRRFIDSDPGETIAAQAAENIERCEEQLAEEVDEDLMVIDEDADEDIVDAVLAEPEPLVTSEPEPTSTPQDDLRPWYRDPVGGALFGAGLVGVGVGLGLYGGASSVAKSVADEDSHQGYADRRRRAGALRTGSVVVVSLGSALLVGAVVRYGLQSRKAKQTELTGWIDGSGGGLSWTGRF
jgi:tetratricopeptide (TPR) repeat protein